MSSYLALTLTPTLTLASVVPGDDEGLARLERDDARGARAHLEHAELAWSGARVRARVRVGVRVRVRVRFRVRVRVRVKG